MGLLGDVPKWLKGPDSKSGRRRKACGGSNPSISATKITTPFGVVIFRGTVGLKMLGRTESALRQGFRLQRKHLHSAKAPPYRVGSRSCVSSKAFASFKPEQAFLCLLRFFCSKDAGSRSSWHLCCAADHDSCIQSTQDLAKRLSLRQTK